MLQSAIQAWAILSGRDHANEDDLKAVAPYVLLHRLKFHGNNKEALGLLKNIMEPAIESLIRRGV